MKKTFMEFLNDRHVKTYAGLDDEMSDDFNDWYSNLNNFELVDYADKFADEQMLAFSKSVSKIGHSQTLRLLNE